MEATQVAVEATQGLLLLHSTLGLLGCHNSTLGLLRCHNSYLGCLNSLQSVHKNIRSDLIRAGKPPFGLKLRPVTALLPRMLLECLICQKGNKSARKLAKLTFSRILGPSPLWWRGVAIVHTVQNRREQAYIALRAVLQRSRAQVRMGLAAP